MKLNTILETAEIAIDDFIALLEKDTVFNSLNQQVIIEYNETTKLERLRLLFTQEFSSDTAPCLYLNQQIDQMIELQDPTMRDLEFKLNPVDILIIPITPLKLVYHSKLSKAHVQRFLKSLQIFLHKKSEKLLCGWTLTSLNEYSYYTNTSTGIDWSFFYPFVKSITPDGEQDSILLDKSLDNHAYEAIQCFLTPNQFVRLQETHGLITLVETVFSRNLTEFITSQETDTFRLKTIKRMLTPKNGKREFTILCDTIKGILNQRPTEGISEVEVRHYDNLKNLYELIRPIVEINSKIPAEGLTTQSEAQQSKEHKKATIKSASELNHTSTNLTRKLLQSLSEIELNSVLLQETLLTAPILNDPYKAEDEQLIRELLHNISPLFHELKILATEKTFTAEDRAHLLGWLKSSIHSLKEIILLFSFLHYRMTTLELSHVLIELLFSLRNKIAQNELNYINNQIHLLKDPLLNACLYSGLYERALYWLDICATIPCTMSENTGFIYYYSKGQELHYRAQIAQLTGDFEGAITLGNQIKEYIEVAYSILLSEYGEDNNKSSSQKKNTRQRGLAQRYYDPLIATEFLKATKIYISLYAFSHLSLYMELFQFNHFLVACEPLKIVANELEDSKTCLEITNKIRSRLKLTIDSTSKAKKPLIFHDITTDKIRWCMIRHYLLIKNILKKHLPDSFDLLEKNETLVLSAKKTSCAKRLHSTLKENSIQCSLYKNSITLSSFETYKIDDLKRALQLSSETHPTHQALTANNQKMITQEELRLRSLKYLHYQYLTNQKKELFDILNKELNLFYNECKNPLLRIKTLMILISLNLSASFLSWANGQYDDAEQFFRISDTYAESAFQLLLDLRSNEHFTEATLLCNTIKDKIDSHLDITSQVLFSSFIKSSSDYLKTVKQNYTHKNDCFHWYRVGLNNMLTLYKNSEEIRDILFRKTLCFEVSNYEKRQQLLAESTQLSFEAAYELLTQTPLSNIEGNTPEVALLRAQTAYKNLCDLKDHSEISLPSYIQSYIFVLKTIFEPDLSLTQILDYLNLALKTANSHTNMAHKIEIILRKLDWIANGEIDSKVSHFLDELKELHKLIQSLTAKRSSSYSKQVLITVIRYFFLFFSYDLPYTTTPSTKVQNEELELHDTILSILAYLEDTLLVNDGSDFALSSVDNINTLRSMIKIRYLLILNTSLEHKIRSDLVETSMYSDQIQLLTTKIIISFSRLLRYEGPLITPHSPLINLAITCHQMMSYSTSEQDNTNPEVQNLIKVYNTVSELTINTLPSLLQDQFKVIYAPSADVMSGFKQLVALIDCLNNAHHERGATISSDQIPLLKKMCECFPDNIYIAYTLFRVLSDNNPHDVECREAVEACRKAADAGHPHAQYYYSKILDRGNFGVSVDREKAQDYLQKSNNNGYYRAQIRLAKLYKSGLFGNADHNKEAARFHAKAAMKNPETPINARVKLVDQYNILFLPYQLF